MQTIAISDKNLVKFIDENVKGTTFVSIDAVTPEKLPKSCPIQNVLKAQTRTGVIGFDYESSVNRQDVREGGEGEREAKSRKWGTTSPCRKWVSHIKKGETNTVRYLQMKVEQTKNITYTSNGKTIDKSEIADFIRKPSVSSTQEGLEKQVIIRDINLANVKAIRIMGKSYEIVHGTDVCPDFSKVEVMA
jgi:hypothetical protein